MEITLETNNKRLIVQSKRMGTNSNGFFCVFCTPLKKKIQSILERHFHRAKWIRLRHFELASSLNVLLACNQTANSMQKIEKLAKATEQAEKTLFVYSTRASREVKKLKKEIADLKNLSKAQMKITLLVKRELESASEAFRRREKLQAHLRGAAHTLLNGKSISCIKSGKRR
jgi:hypothetical protein